MNNKVLLFLFAVCLTLIQTEAKAGNKERNIFLHAGFGYGGYSIKFQNEEIKNITAKAINFNFGIGYTLKSRDFFSDLYLGFLGNLNQNDLIREGVGSGFKFNGNNNSFLALAHFGKKLNKVEPYLIGGFSGSSLSYKTYNKVNTISSQKNYFNLGVAYGLGFNIPSENQNTVFTFKFIRIRGLNNNNYSNLCRTKIGHLFINIGAKYYFN